MKEPAPKAIGGNKIRASKRRHDTTRSRPRVNTLFDTCEKREERFPYTAGHLAFSLCASIINRSSLCSDSGRV